MDLTPWKLQKEFNDANDMMKRACKKFERKLDIATQCYEMLNESFGLAQKLTQAINVLFASSTQTPIIYESNRKHNFKIQLESENKHISSILMGKMHSLIEGIDLIKVPEQFSTQLLKIKDKYMEQFDNLMHRLNRTALSEYSTVECNSLNRKIMAELWPHEKLYSYDLAEFFYSKPFEIRYHQESCSVDTDLEEKFPILSGLSC